MSHFYFCLPWLESCIPVIFICTPLSFWNITVLWSNTTQIVITHNLVLNWRFTLVLIKINYGQIGDQTGLFNTTNPVFYTSGNRFVRRTGTFGNLIFSLVSSDNHNTRSTCPTSVFTGIGQTLMSRPGHFQQSFSLYIYNGLGTFFQDNGNKQKIHSVWH